MKLKSSFTFIFALILFFCFSDVRVSAQSDHETPEKLVAAVYDVISGEAGKQRDWDRFRSLFHPSARMIATGRNPNTGAMNASALTTEDYISRTNEMFLRDGFIEREIKNRTERFGNIVHVFSSYEAFRTVKDEKPFLRGVNSFQLIFDGKRWWVVTILWQAEDKDTPLPKNLDRRTSGKSRR
jgi:hypothetical protein